MAGVTEGKKWETLECVVVMEDGFEKGLCCDFVIICGLGEITEPSVGRIR